MKKSFLQRAMALILMTLLILGSVFTAKAAESSEDSSAESSAEDLTVIDDQKSGNIVVTKYVTLSSDPAEAGNASGTQGDQQQVSEDYTPLEGACYILVPIRDAAYVVSYYNGTNADELKASDEFAKLIVELDENGDIQSVTLDGIELTSDQYYVETTDEKGEASFTDIPVGMYILREVAAPPQIHALSQDSLISMPMVNTLHSENTGEDEESVWMYDIYVFPKNQANESAVTVTKLDREDGSTPVAEVEFELYSWEIRKDQTPSDEEWVKIEQLDEEGNVIPNLTGSDGTLTITGLKTGTQNTLGTQFKLVEVSAPTGYIANQTPLYFYIDSYRIIHWNKTSEGENGCTNQNIFVDTEEGAPQVEDNTKLSFTLFNEQPDLEKKVQQNAQDPSWTKDEQYRLTDTISYRLLVKVPESLPNMKTFTIVDTPAKGMTDLTTDFAVNYYDGTNLVSFNSFSVEANAATEENGAGFTFTITGDQEKIAGKYLEIIYTAVFNENAVINEDGNLNTAVLTYSVVTDDDDDDDETYTIQDSAAVYTYDFKITKHMDTKEGQVIPDVEFILLDADQKTTIPVVNVDSGLYRLALPGEDGEIMVTNAAGTIRIHGLENSKYFLKETKTITGYNLLSEPFEIEVEVARETSWTEDTGFLEEGRVVASYISTAYNGEENGDPTGSADIINKKGFVLPQTGSMGYLLFSVVGILLVAGGALLLFGGRKKKIH